MKKKTTRKTATPKRSHRTAKQQRARTRVTTHNGSIDIENGLGGMKTARAIAKSLKQAADASENLTTAPFHAAMAALDHLIAFLDRQKERLEAAKDELRKLYGESVDDESKRRHSGGPTRENRSPVAKGARARRTRKRGETLTSSDLAWSRILLAI